MKKKNAVSGKGPATKAKPINPADTLVDAGLALLRAGKKDEATLQFRQAITKDPRNINAWLHAGLLSAHAGRQTDALRELRTAAQLAPHHGEIQTDLCCGFSQICYWDEAIAAGVRATSLSPMNPRAHLALGFALKESGQRAAAVPVLQQAIAFEPFAMDNYIELHSALWDDENPSPAREAILHAVALDPKHPRARFYLGVTYGLLGEVKLARAQFEAIGKSVYQGAIDSWDYVAARRQKSTRFFSTTPEMLRFAAKQATVDEGIVLEFGVRFGASTRVLAQAISGPIHGFDSFAGLPEPWHIHETGIYSTHGQVPEVPANVHLHIGLFAETLPGFLREHAGPVRLVNVDCDLYSSTLESLELLAERLVPGTIVIFDEYLVNDRWRLDEYKAFQEIVAKHGFTYEYLAFSLHTGQAVVRMLGKR